MKTETEEKPPAELEPGKESRALTCSLFGVEAPGEQVEAFKGHLLGHVRRETEKATGDPMPEKWRVAVELLPDTALLRTCCVEFRDFVERAFVNFCKENA